jgi:hypothetical protein
MEYVKWLVRKPLSGLPEKETAIGASIRDPSERQCYSSKLMVPRSNPSFVDVTVS